MNKITFILLGIVSAVFSLGETLDIKNILSALAAFGLAVWLPWLMIRAKKEQELAKAAPSLWGVLATLFVLIYLQANLVEMPSYFFWPLAAALSAIGGYTFQAYFSTTPRAEPRAEKPEKELAKTQPKSKPKILDTSVIIDGRIADIVDTGFVEGPFVVPNFVLREIQLISDSPEGIKRNRGRRGLDILNQLQKKKEPEITISYHDYPEIRDVDSKLIRLTKELGGVLVTNDYNLNKVAEIEGVRVLNINHLALALKPVVLPGEELEIQIMREGKDENQGIGYLEDGTMVVVESGAKLLGKKVKVSVNSVLQTNAGKMVFTKIAGT